MADGTQTLLLRSPCGKPGLGVRPAAPLYAVGRGTMEEGCLRSCTLHGGDLLIGGSALMIALLFVGDGRWPHACFGRVAVVAGAGRLAYTVFSEWLNTEIRGSWAYSTWMPVLPVIGTGLAPFLQSIIVPWVALWWVRPRSGPTDKVLTPMPSS